MSKKKLYSFRAEPELLSALRAKADKQGTTVSDVITTVLSEAMNLPKSTEQRQYLGISNGATKTLIEEIKREVTAQIRKEITAQIKKELEETK
ncbi:MAG: hypothetical protein AAFN40_07435 [Cyanobacteria bacterium J06560_6]